MTPMKWFYSFLKKYWLRMVSGLILVTILAATALQRRKKVLILIRWEMLLRPAALNVRQQSVCTTKIAPVTRERSV